MVAARRREPANPHHAANLSPVISESTGQFVTSIARNGMRLCRLHTCQISRQEHAVSEQGVPRGYRLFCSDVTHGVSPSKQRFKAVTFLG